MGFLFYKNDSNSLRIFQDHEGDYDNYTLEVGDEENPDPFYLPGVYVEQVPMTKEGISHFIKEIKKFNPLLLKAVEKESDLIKALRETKKCAEEEKEFEKTHPWVKKIF